MTENPEKNEKHEEEKPEETNEAEKDNKKNESEDTKEKFVWVDKDGKKPISYLMPMYIGVGAVMLIIWILIIVFAVGPNWDEFDANKKDVNKGLEIDIVDNKDATIKPSPSPNTPEKKD